MQGEATVKPHHRRLGAGGRSGVGWGWRASQGKVLLSKGPEAEPTQPGVLEEQQGGTVTGRVRESGR